MEQDAIENNVHIRVFTADGNNDIVQTLSLFENEIIDTLESRVSLHGGIKWWLSIFVTYIRQTEDGEVIYNTVVFHSDTFRLFPGDNIAPDIATVFNQLYSHSEEYVSNGSSWSIHAIEKLELHNVRHVPLGVGTYIPLPCRLPARSVINVKNRNDNKCVVWSILAHLRPNSKRPNNVESYKEFEGLLNLEGVRFPTPVTDIAKIENQNNLSIHVFIYETENRRNNTDSVLTSGLAPYRISKEIKKTHINLLLINAGAASIPENYVKDFKESSKSFIHHYCLITNFHLLIKNQLPDKRLYYTRYCYNCLQQFSTQKSLDTHTSYCNHAKCQRTKFPSCDNDKWIKFTNFGKQLRAPFVIYADFECFTQKINTTNTHEQRSTVFPYQKHVPSGFCYIVVSTHNTHNGMPVLYRGPKVVEKFFESIIEEESRIAALLKKPVALTRTNDVELKFELSTHCHICDGRFENHTEKVRDHDHLDGSYRGAAHSSCNLKYRWSKLNPLGRYGFKIPVIFHNLRGYDSHLLMEAFGKFKNRRLSCVATNCERFVTFSTGSLTFIDSFQFMSSSLDRLVRNLAEENDNLFQNLKRVFKSESHRKLLLRKGVFPYDYFDCESRFGETQLPSQKCFYSTLNQEECTDEDYGHAKNVWRSFDCQTFGDYHDLYLCSDVVQLADVFENFRNMALQTYRLDPAHYYTAPGLSWDAMLRYCCNIHIYIYIMHLCYLFIHFLIHFRYTKIEIELITDPTMFLMIENSIRGGLSVVVHKYAKANNEYLADYNPDNNTSHCVYLDANNLYGWAMSQMMPFKGMRWLSSEEAQNLNYLEVSDDSTKGYILEVDIEYPKELHDKHSDLPCAPIKRCVEHHELSPYSLELMHTSRAVESSSTSDCSLESNIRKAAATSKKLIADLHNKTKYVVHYRNLKLYTRLGLKVTQVHRVVEFEQSNWLSKYIELNTNMRKQARNSFEKDFFKLMNNSVFGKTMENTRNRIDMSLVSDPDQLVKLTKLPRFQRTHIINDNLVSVKCLTTSVILNKPIYIGFCILDLSKTLMYEFHYDVIRSTYGSKAKLCFTDTDSLLYWIETNDIYSDMLCQSNCYDTSDYPVHHPLHSTKNKKVLGKMKDEMAGIAISEFVGLRAKMYSLRTSAGIEKKTAKGVKRATIRKCLRHAMYVECLRSGKTTRELVRSIRSYNHQIFSTVHQKIALSSFDDKRFVLSDKVTTRAHGHYKNSFDSSGAAVLKEATTTICTATSPQTATTTATTATTSKEITSSSGNVIDPYQTITRSIPKDTAPMH